MDTTRLRELTDVAGPFASVYFDESHDTEDAASQLSLRIKEIEAALKAEGADEQTVSAISEAITASSPPAGRTGRVLVASHGEVRLDERLAGPPASTEARWSALPYLLPLVTHFEEHPPYVTVVVDQVGAELTSHGPDGTHTETVHGTEHPVHEVRGGGTAHRDIRARAEETTRHNLDLVAEQVVKAAEAAELVVLAGEVQSRSALYTVLPEHVRRRTKEIEGGSRAAGASQDELDRRIGELLTGHHLARLDELAETFRAETGREQGLAVTGLDAVTTALAQANVATLLVGCDPAAATVYTGEEPAQVAVGKSELETLGVREPAAHPADEALPFAAIATGADVVVIDERLALWEGFGALLRHT